QVISKADNRIVECDSKVGDRLVLVLEERQHRSDDTRSGLHVDAVHRLVWAWRKVGAEELECAVDEMHSHGRGMVRVGSVSESHRRRRHRQRHLKKRTAKTKLTPPQVAHRPSFPATADSGAPSIITARSASFSAVSGIYRIKGWSPSGNRDDEKKTPEQRYIGK